MAWEQRQGIKLVATSMESTDAFSRQHELFPPIEQQGPVQALTVSVSVAEIVLSPSQKLNDASLP